MNTSTKRLPQFSRRLAHLLVPLMCILGCALGSERTVAQPPFAGFDDLTAGVTAQRGEDALELTVTLGRELPLFDTSGTCFEAADDLVVRVGAVELERIRRGGEAAPMRLSGVEFRTSRCDPALFRGVVDPALLARPRASSSDADALAVTVEQGARRARVLVSRTSLTEPRADFGVLRPGGEVEVRWVWPGELMTNPFTTLHLYVDEGGTSRTWAIPARMHDGKLAFDVPGDVPNGPGRIEFALPYPMVRLQPQACVGLRECLGWTEFRLRSRSVQIAR